MADQTINFNALSDKTLGNSDFDVSATSTSGLTVTFTSQTTDICSMSTTTAHLVSTGTCTIRASQAGNTNYNAATNVDRSFTVNVAPRRSRIGNNNVTIPLAVQEEATSTDSATTSSTTTTDATTPTTENPAQSSPTVVVEAAAVPTPQIDESVPSSSVEPETLGNALLAVASPAIKRAISVVHETNDLDVSKYVSVNIPNGPIYITDVATGVTKRVAVGPGEDDSIVSPQTASVFDASKQAGLAGLDNVFYIIIIALFGIALLSYAAYKIKHSKQKTYSWPETLK